MQLKRLITHFTYRIEPKPEGGFVAHSADPTTPPLEAGSRDEMLEKIQAKIAANLASEFPGLKFPLENQEVKNAFHIESTPEGRFAIHSADPAAQPVETVTHEEIESQIAEKLIALMGKDIPRLQALAAQGKGGDIKVSVNRKPGSTMHVVNLGIRRGLPPTGSIQPHEAKVGDANSGEPETITAGFDSVGHTIGNSPITPESGTGWTIFRFLFALLVVATLMYVFFHHR